MDRINRTTKVPYYQQLYEILRGKIARREWKPGDLIPPESELIRQYAVSRNTVRQVLDMLVKEGLLYRHRGRGSFVAHPTVEQTLVRIVSFTEDMHQREFEPGTRVMASSLMRAPADIAEKLNVAPGEELAHLKRLRLADDEPMSIEESYLVHRFCPGVLKGNYAKRALRQVLARDYSIRLVRAKQVIRAVAASPEHARVLEIKPKAPLLLVERVSFSQKDVPVEFLRIYYRADRYSLYNELHD